MASYKGTRGLDQSTRNTLSALDLALQQDDTKPKQDDEFTIAEYIAGMRAKGVNLALRTATGRLDNMVHNGLLKKRRMMIGSRFTNLYSKQ